MWSLVVSATTGGLGTIAIAAIGALLVAVLSGVTVAWITHTLTRSYEYANKLRLAYVDLLAATEQITLIALKVAIDRANIPFGTTPPNPRSLEAVDRLRASGDDFYNSRGGIVRALNMVKLLESEPKYLKLVEALEEQVSVVVKAIKKSVDDTRAANKTLNKMGTDLPAELREHHPMLRPPGRVARFVQRHFA